ncbi:hypothetical protein GWI33_020538 [Rhynchophorus ferrugineus]|uniref:Uncharacterized protein n=1 Tax=Rhynchophorus ferrugineus TaxID=354439 RepID=A0A834M382_RHYFE|nr:hypothetical protein GWI33_020538 [Rhynchophorus ferrugineus]
MLERFPADHQTSEKQQTRPWRAREKRRRRRGNVASKFCLATGSLPGRVALKNNCTSPEPAAFVSKRQRTWSDTISYYFFARQHIPNNKTAISTVTRSCSFTSEVTPVILQIGTGIIREISGRFKEREKTYLGRRYELAWS